MHKVELLQHSEHGGQAVCGSLTGLGLHMCMIGAGCGPRALAAGTHVNLLAFHCVG